MARGAQYPPNTHEILRETYLTARRLAMGIDKALDSLLAVLEADKSSKQKG